MAVSDELGNMPFTRADSGWSQGDSNPNTVKLVSLDVVDGVIVGLGPASVVGAFDLPFRHLAFDHARCGSVSSGWVESVDESSEEDRPVSFRGRVRGENRPRGRWWSE